MKRLSRIFKKLKNIISTKEKGIALLLVVIMISIMIPIVTDMNYEARNEFQMAMNYKRKAEADVLAQSAVNFATVVFDLQKQLNMVMKQLGMNSQTTKIWDIIPFDTAILRNFASAGPFASMEDLNQEKDKKSGDKQQKVDTSMYMETGDALFDFDGDFSIDFESEDTKINLNNLAFASRGVVITMLEGIIEPDMYDFLFLENTSRPQYVDRKELIQNIVDWVDTNNEKYTDGKKYIEGGDESSLYSDFDPPYKVKNAKFDTISELHMVYGVTDIIYRLLEPYITIYSTGKININKANPFMLEAIIRSYATDKTLSIFSDQNQMREFMAKILAKRAKDGFKNISDFIKKVREEGVVLKSSVKRAIGTTGNVYRIKAIGKKSGVESWIELVVDQEGNIYYYKKG